VYVFGHSIGGVIGPRLVAGSSGVGGLIVAETVGINWFSYEMINERRQATLDRLTAVQIDADAATEEFLHARSFDRKEIDGGCGKGEPGLCGV
jgi:hypothetical protein